MYLPYFEPPRVSETLNVMRTAHVHMENGTTKILKIRNMTVKMITQLDWIFDFWTFAFVIFQFKQYKTRYILHSFKCQQILLDNVLECVVYIITVHIEALV